MNRQRDICLEGATLPAMVSLQPPLGWDAGQEGAVSERLSSLSERRALLVLCALEGTNWFALAREVLGSGRVDGAAKGTFRESSETAMTTAMAIRRATKADVEKAEERVDRELEAARSVGANLVTVLDHASYPTNLSLVYNLPPFLFFRGALSDADSRSIAVVGTRQASEVGRSQAHAMAYALASVGVTVVSGLARGIDTQAHRGALDAGARTVAVVGTGICHTYPRENASLADEVASRGAVVSQFWPTASGSRGSFPMRNVTMSGMAQGTVVVEASSTSGAKMQARVALEHGKKVFLMKSLLEIQSWAQTFSTRPNCFVVDGAQEVIRSLVPTDRIVERARLRSETLATLR